MSVFITANSNRSFAPNTSLALLPACMDHILELPDGSKRFCDAVLSMAKAFCALAAMALTDEVAFLQAVRARLQLKFRNMLKRFKYPPDQEATATDLVLIQAEAMSEA